MIAIENIRSPEVREMASEASDFLSSHQWCGEVTSGRLALAVAGVVGVFQFDFVPAAPGVDDTLWVVVGDLPPAYLVRDESPGWQEALRSYVHEMRRWVAAVRGGSDLDDVIPVGAAPTPEHAEMLESRLNFLDSELIQVPADSIEGDI